MKFYSWYIEAESDAANNLNSFFEIYKTICDYNLFNFMTSIDVTCDI